MGRLGLPDRLILASGSPRRLDLLRSIGCQPVVIPADVDETQRMGESPIDYVRRLATDKASVVAAGHPTATIVAADTTVEIGGDVLGKPRDVTEARAMISRLAGRTHRVHTGVSVRRADVHEQVVVTTDVTFGVLLPAVIDWYVSFGESLDKAGGYALQGAGAVLVERVDGSVSNVIGLPLRETVELLRTIGGDPG